MTLASPCRDLSPYYSKHAKLKLLPRRTSYGTANCTSVISISLFSILRHGEFVQSELQEMSMLVLVCVSSPKRMRYA